MTVDDLQKSSMPNVELGIASLKYKFSIETIKFRNEDITYEQA